MTEENKIPTPKDWNWLITSEDVAKIKMNDRETVNKVYFDNYERLKRIALKKAYKFCKRDMWEDCLNQIYIDLPLYDYTNALTLSRGIVSTAYRVINPNRFLSLDAEYDYEKGNVLALLDRIPVDGFVELAQKESEKKVLKIIAEQTGLNDLQRDTLVAIAFRCAMYRGIFNYEFARISS